MKYRFDDMVLDLQRQELLRQGRMLPVEPQVFDLLAYLVTHRDRVVSKDDLLSSVWKGRIVSESTLSSRITLARHIIGDRGDTQRYIRTIARKGFRFVGDVREDEETQPAAISAADPVRPAPYFAHALTGKPSIAVLPFANMSGDPEQDYFSDGMTEDIIAALSRLHWFFVIARNSAFAYKDRDVEVQQIGRDLGVRYVLEGSVRKSGSRLRITGQLIEAETGAYLWVDRYDRELTDIFALQDEITTSVTAAIEPKLLAAESLRAERRSVHDLDAWDMVARALAHFWKFSEPEGRSAIEMLRQAVQRYPDYAPAQSMLAFAILVSGHIGWPVTMLDREDAARLAQRAAALDDNDPWAHVALGYLAFTTRHTDEAVRHFQAALDLNPNFAAAHGYTAWALSFAGRSDEAIAHAQMAIRISPRDPLNCFFYSSMAAAHYMAGRYDEAVEWIRRALQQRSELVLAHRMHCASLAQAGRMDEAASALVRLRALQPGLSIAWIRDKVPYTDGNMEHFLAGMRKAGLSD